MDLSAAPFMKHFSVLEDPRLDRTKKHLLTDIIAIAVMASLCGIDSCEGMAIFAEKRLDWLKGFLKLPNGAPSHDTFSRVFSRIDPKKFQICFVNWMRDVVDLTSGEVVAIDGKTLRRSFDRASGKSAIHMVSAWAVQNGVSLGQISTDEKSNEITAIPKLLEALCLKGCIVTIDALGCQREICKKICELESDYTIALKKNQDRLHFDVKNIFDHLNKKDASAEYFTTVESSKGRQETRHAIIYRDVELLQERHNWPGLKSIGVIQTIRTVSQQTQVEFRYYINSHVPTAEKFLGSTREHWHIENKLHWVLDVSFGEDQNRARVGNAAENLSTLKRITINLLKQENVSKKSIPNKRFMCALDSEYMVKTLLSHQI